MCVRENWGEETQREGKRGDGGGGETAIGIQNK